MAVGVMRILARHNIKVPGEMSVVGFDDIHLAEFANPPLTTVRMSREELARCAFSAIQQLINSDATITHPPVRVGTSLIVRESTDFHTEATHGLQIDRRGLGTAV